MSYYGKMQNRAYSTSLKKILSDGEMNTMKWRKLSRRSNAPANAKLLQVVVSSDVAQSEAETVSAQSKQFDPVWHAVEPIKFQNSL